MTPEQQVRNASIIAAIFAGVATITSSLAAWYAHNPRSAADVHIMQHIESPITASGGSMTFRAQSTWDCANRVGTMMNVYTDCASAAVINTVGADDVQDSGNPNITPPERPVPATVVLHIRQTGAVITLCTSASPLANGGCGAGNNVHVNVSGRPNVAGLIRSAAADVHVDAVQYYDATCHVHGTTADAKGNDSPLSPIPFCEHAGAVDWPNGSHYSCKHGACRIYFYNRP